MTRPRDPPPMTTVAIGDCASCGLLGSDIEVQQTLFDELGRDLEHARRILDDDGVFEVHVDDQVL